MLFITVSRVDIRLQARNTKYPLIYHTIFFFTQTIVLQLSCSENVIFEKRGENLKVVFSTNLI